MRLINFVLPVLAIASQANASELLSSGPFEVDPVTFAGRRRHTGATGNENVTGGGGGGMGIGNAAPARGNSNSAGRGNDQRTGQSVSQDRSNRALSPIEERSRQMLTSNTESELRQRRRRPLNHEKAEDQSESLAFLNFEAVASALSTNHHSNLPSPFEIDEDEQRPLLRSRFNQHRIDGHDHRMNNNESRQSHLIEDDEQNEINWEYNPQIYGTNRIGQVFEPYPQINASAASVNDETSVAIAVPVAEVNGNPNRAATSFLDYATSCITSLFSQSEAHLPGSSNSNTRTPISSGSGHSIQDSSSNMPGLESQMMAINDCKLPLQDNEEVNSDMKFDKEGQRDKITCLVNTLLEKQKSNTKVEDKEEEDDDSQSYNSDLTFEEYEDFQANAEIENENDDKPVVAAVKSDDYDSDLEFEIQPATHDPFAIKPDNGELVESDGPGSLKTAMVDKLKHDFIKNREKMIKMNAAAYLNIKLLMLKREGQRRGAHSVSHPLKRLFSPSNQMSSLSCSVFPVLGAMRYHLAEKINIHNNFSFNPWHLTFYDLFEKSNAFLELILRKIDLPMESTELGLIFEQGINQASDWQSNMRLVEKYGILPNFETVRRENNTNPHAVIAVLNSCLRASAKALHVAHRSGNKDLKELKDSAIKTVFTILATSFGVPAGSFEWEFNDRDGKSYEYSFEDGPKEFYRDIVGSNFGNQITICNYPHLQFNRYIGIQIPHRMIEYPYRYFVNISTEKMVEYALKVILSNRPLPVTGLLAAFDSVANGVLDEQRFDHEALFGIENFFMSKKDIYLTRNWSALHAFLIVGVDLDKNGYPINWLVESSWGTRNRSKDHLLMTQAWFEKYIFEIIVPKDMLFEEESVLIQSGPSHFDNEAEIETEEA